MNPQQNPHPHRALISWAFFDFANSAFSAIIQTFVFAAYFTQEVAKTPMIGTSEWGAAISIAGLAVAIGSPILGAVADESGHRKRWIGIFVSLVIVSTACLWFIHPSPIYVLPAMILVAIGTMGSEFAFVFYSSMLPTLAPRDRMGRWSGWGWGLGYAGGTIALTLILVLFIHNGGLWPELDQGGRENLRASFILTAAWIFLFSLPFFIFTPEAPAPQKPFLRAVKAGIGQLVDTFAHVRRYSQIVRFFFAYIFYIDGLTTLFAFGGVYAASTFHLSSQEVLIFGISLNLVGGMGAALFAFVDDRIGGKKTIMLSLVCLVMTASLALSAVTITYFWVFGIGMGLFVGPIQASTRSFMARIAPVDLRTQMFGFLAFSGKATAFLGPALVSWATYATGSERLGMCPIVVMLVVGALILLTVPSDSYAG